MQIKDYSPLPTLSGRIVNTKPVPGTSRKKEGMHLERSVALGAQFFLDKINQRANSRKGGPFDLVIIHREPEMIFKRSQERYDRHGIEFGHGAKQRSACAKAGRTAFEAENFVQDGQDFFLDNQTDAPESSIKVEAL